MKNIDRYDELSLMDAAAMCIVYCNDPSLTLQGPATEADINFIVRSFGILKAQEAMPMVTDPRYYADLSDVPDLRSALERVQDARDKFQALPALVRRRFDNNPVEFMEFCADASNRDEAVRLGLIVEAPPPPAPPPAAPAV